MSNSSPIKFRTWTLSWGRIPDRDPSDGEYVARAGLVPIILWPYDIGGTATLFLATRTRGMECNWTCCTIRVA